MDDVSQRLVPDELWTLVEPLIPGFAARPQGGGTAPVDDRAVFTAIVFVLTSGCPWRLLPPSFGVTVPTAHRWFTERTKAGVWRRIHVLTDRQGIPLSVAVSGANTHDSQALAPLVMVIPAIRSRRGRRRRRPDKLHADKAYDSSELRGWVRDRGIGVHIARKGIEPSDSLGRHRWVIERTIAWTFDYRRLATRYERHGNNFCAFLALAAALTCFKKLPM